MFINYDYKSMFDPDSILIYLRKSRSDDPLLTVGEVLQRHETILDNWCEQNLGALIPQENRFREVVSGETIEDRIEIQKVLSKLESPKYKALLCVEVQRLSRGDLEDAGKLIKLLRFSNTYVITPQKTYDLEDEYDRDIFERELKRGNEFLEYQKRILDRGRRLSVSQGNFVGSRPPYGYNKVWETENKRKRPVLAENKEQADVIRLIFDLFVNKDMGLQRICNRLEELNITPPRDEYWSVSTLKGILTNVHYIGKIKWDSRKTTTVVIGGEIVQKRPRLKLGEYPVYDGKHEGIISEEMFQAAQGKIGRLTREKPSTKLVNPFAGLLYCACGSALSFKRYKDTSGKEKNSPRMLCNNQRHCKTGSCEYDEILDKVCDALSQCIKDFEIRKKSVDSNTSVELHQRVIKNLEKKLKDIEAKEISQWEMQADPDPDVRMPQAVFKVLNEKLLQEKKDTQLALKNAYETIPKPVNYDEHIIRFKDALDALRNPKADVELKNRLLKACIERIEYHRGTPQRLKKKEGEKKGTLPLYGGWTTPPIELDIAFKLKRGV